MKRLLQALTLLAVLLTACAQPTPEPTHPPIPTLTPLPSLTPTFTPSPTPYRSPTPTPYQKPHRLPPEEAKELFLELYETNGGCELPCWWGITPGETTFEEALDIVLPIGMMSDSEPFKYKKWLVYSLGIFVPKDFEDFSSFGFKLITPANSRDPYYGIVTGIQIEDTYTKPYNDFVLADYLKLLGEPDQIYIDIHLFHVYFKLFYIDEGIVIYSELNENKLTHETKFKACPQYADMWYWNTWNPHTVVLKDMVDGSKSGNNYFPLEEVTDLTIHEFYEIYLNPDTDYCVEGKVDVE